jgi:CBS domain-containing protein
MRELRVRDVMTTKVVAVTPSTPFRQVAELLLDHRIGAVPVIDDTGGGLLGLISEADLISKQAYGGRRGGSARGTGRSQARVARELMSAPVETTRADDTLPLVARRMVDCGLRHLVVLDECGRMVGIVSRRDLVRVFLRPDHQISASVKAELAASGYDAAGVAGSVDSGIVTLDGPVPDPGDTPGICRLAWLVPGVVDVVDHLTVSSTRGG